MHDRKYFFGPDFLPEGWSWRYTVAPSPNCLETKKSFTTLTAGVALHILSFNKPTYCDFILHFKHKIPSRYYLYL